MKIWRTLGVATMLSLLPFFGGRGDDGPSRPAAEGGKPSAEPTEKPWMFSEASLPQGFPPPGPVDRVVVKTYPAHRLARVTADGGSNGMFMKLFRHIERNEIAMTAPVEMTWRPQPGEAAADRPVGEPSRMAFLYGSPTIGQTGADPKDAEVVVEDVPEMRVVSVGVRGAYDAKGFDRGRQRLESWLSEHPEWKPVGPPRTLGYNSPFVPWFARFAEVQIPVEPAKD